MTDHDNALMSEVATKQDLYNVGVLIDSNFKSLAGDIHNLRTELAKGFAMIDSHFIAFRAEMATGFATCLYEVKKTIRRTYFALFLAIAALLSIDRWWS